MNVEQCGGGEVFEGLMKLFIFINVSFFISQTTYQ
jgi:hypothetical protein